MTHYSQLDETIKLINKEDNYLLLSHINPDGDNIGSLVGLALGLQQLNKNVIAANVDITPRKYQFITNNFPISSEEDCKDFSGIIIVLDCSDLERTGLQDRKIFNDNMVINIDHHVSNIFFGAVNLVDIKAAATGEIVLKLLRALRVNFTKEISTGLYTAIMTDTGSFRFSNTTKFSLESAAFLLERGASLDEINVQVYETVSLASIRFKAVALNGLELNEEGNIAWIIIERKLYRQFGVSDEEYEGLVNYAKSVAGVEVAFLVKELENGNYKVSLRSKGKIDVNDIAAVFGGGGHNKAAGIIAEGYGSITELTTKILAEINNKLINILKV